MEQAKARNPDIKLYGLAWGAPGWIGNGNFWSTDMINYLLALARLRRNSHGLTIDYLGGWNERGYNKAWYEQLRAALNSQRLRQRQDRRRRHELGASADDVVSDPAFARRRRRHRLALRLRLPRPRRATVPARPTPSPPARRCGPARTARTTTTPGAVALARGINRGYIDGKMTAYINWPVVAAITPEPAVPDDGRRRWPPQPWSGAYSIGKNAWVMAHTTQFTAPGLAATSTRASGYLGGNRANGSYVTLRVPTSADY